MLGIENNMSDPFIDLCHKVHFAWSTICCTQGYGLIRYWIELWGIKEAECKISNRGLSKEKFSSNHMQQKQHESWPLLQKKDIPRQGPHCVLRYTYLPQRGLRKCLKVNSVAHTDWRYRANSLVLLFDPLDILNKKIFKEESLCCGFFRCSASPSLSRLTKQLWVEYVNFSFCFCWWFYTLHVIFW